MTAYELLNTYYWEILKMETAYDVMIALYQVQIVLTIIAAIYFTTIKDTNEKYTVIQALVLIWNIYLCLYIRYIYSH